MAIHDWGRVSAGTFHDFHTSWTTHLKEALNGGVLPQAYYAMSDPRCGRIVADVLPLSEGPTPAAAADSGTLAVAEAPPKVSLTMAPEEGATYRELRRTLAVPHAQDHRVVALVEIVSPANKDRASSVEEFVEKAVGVVSQGVHLLVIDLLLPRRNDPQGIHGAIWDRFAQEGYAPHGGSR